MRNLLFSVAITLATTACAPDLGELSYTTTHGIRVYEAPDDIGADTIDMLVDRIVAHEAKLHSWPSKGQIDCLAAVPIVFQTETIECGKKTGRGCYSQRPWGEYIRIMPTRDATGRVIEICLPHESLHALLACQLGDPDGDHSAADWLDIRELNIL